MEDTNERSIGGGKISRKSGTITVEDFTSDAHDRDVPEGQLESQALVDDHAQGEDVGGEGVSGLAFEHFRGDEGGGADEGDGLLAAADFLGGIEIADDQRLDGA